MKNDPDFPVDNPEFDEEFIDELMGVVAPDRETFLALCVRDIAAGYRREVEEAARRMFGADGVRVYRRPGSGAAQVLHYVDPDAEEF